MMDDTSGWRSEIQKDAAIGVRLSLFEHNSFYLPGHIAVSENAKYGRPSSGTDGITDGSNKSPVWSVFSDRRYGPHVIDPGKRRPFLTPLGK